MRNVRGLAVAVMPLACLVALSFVSASPQTHDQPTVGAEPPAQSRDDTPASLVMTVGKSVIVDSALPVERISVGFGDVAEATAISPHELVLNGKTPGVTSMIVWQEGEGGGPSTSQCWPAVSWRTAASKPSKWK